LLTGLFSVALFPYEQLAPLLRRSLAAATGAEVQVGAVHGGLGLSGPQLRAVQLQLHWPDPHGEPRRPDLHLDSLHLRAAWSLSWLEGQPALHLDARSPAGRLHGTLWPGRLAFDGGLEMPDASRLAGLWPALDFATGPLQAEFELAPASKGPLPIAGTLSLHGQRGSVALPSVPLPAIPYTSLEADARISEDGWWTVRTLDLEGPLLAFSAHGRLAPLGGISAPETLDLDVDLRHLDPSLQGPAASLGIPAAGGSFHLGGNLARPFLR